MIVRRRSSDEVYDGSLSIIFCMIVCGGVLICYFIQVNRCMMVVWQVFCRMFRHSCAISNGDAGGTHAWNYSYLHDVFNKCAIVLCRQVRCT